jgi:hypothetical protein
MRISRLVLSGAAIGTIAGTGRADLNRTHVFNPNWPPHARFHGAAGWGTVAGSQLLALWLIWRRGSAPAEGDLAIKTAALLPVIAWTPFFPALATPEREWKINQVTCPGWPASRRTSYPRHWYLQLPGSATCCTAADCRRDSEAGGVPRLAQPGWARSPGSRGMALSASPKRHPRSAECRTSPPAQHRSTSSLAPR